MDNSNRSAHRILLPLLLVGLLGGAAGAWTTEDFQSYNYANATTFPNGTTLGAFKYYASNGKGIYFDASGQWGSKGIFRNWDAADGGFNDTDLSFIRSDRSAFDLHSIYLWDDYNGSPNVILRGFRNGVRSYRTVVDPQSTTAGFTYTLDWTDIDSFVISDSTAPPAYSGNGADLSTFIDNIVWEAFVPPTATTGLSSSVGSSTATVSGTVNANNHSTTDSVQYGTTTGYGTTVVASPATTSDTVNISIGASLSGLSPNTLYHWRVKATSAAGTSTGSDATFTTTKAAQTITFPVPGPTNFGTSPTLSATATSGLAVAFSSSTTGVCTVTSGGTLTTVTTGTCTIKADQAGNSSYSAASTVIQSFPVVAVAPGAPMIGTATAGDGQATVAFTAPTSTGGSSITGYTVTSNPGSSTVTGSSSPITVAGLTNGTPYTFTVTAANSAGTGSASVASNTVTPKAVQTITFTDPGSQNFGSYPALFASSTSGLPVTFTSSTTDVCTITSGGLLTTVTAGTCTIDADQAGNGAYAAAPTVSRSFSVVAVVPDAPMIGTATAGDGHVAVAFTAPASSGGAPITSYTATSSPGGLTGTGTSSPITVTGLTNGTAYTFTVTAANTAGTGSASAASNSATPLAVQTITFGSLTSPTYGDSLLVLGATANSGLSVSYSSGNPAAVRISHDTAYLLAADTATITASQSGDASHAAAAPVSRSLTVKRKNLTIAGAAAQDKVYDGTDSATVAGASLFGVVGSDQVTLTLGTATFASKDTGTAKPVTVAGSSLSGTNAGNYGLTEITGLSASIAPRPVTVTARDTSKNAHEADPPLPWSATALVAGDSWTGSPSRDTGETAGDYAIHLGTLSAGPDYALTFHGATFTIHGSTALSTRPALQSNSHALAANPVRVLASAVLGRAQGVLAAGTAQDGDLSVDVLLPGAASVDVSIFDNLGTPVIAWSQDVSTFQVQQLSPTGDGRWILPVRWNLRASDGEPVPSGVYLWKISVLTDDGQKLETVKRLGVR